MANQSATSLHLLILRALSQQQPPITVHYCCSTAKFVRHLLLRSLWYVLEGAGSEGSRRQIVAVRTPHSYLVATHSHDPTRTHIRCIHQPRLHRLGRRVIFTMWIGTRLKVHVLRTTVSAVSMLSEMSTLDGTELTPRSLVSVCGVISRRKLLTAYNSELERLRKSRVDMDFYKSHPYVFSYRWNICSTKIPTNNIAN
jgi:hypothetical protein